MGLSASIDSRNAMTLLENGHLKRLFSTRPGDAPPLIAGRAHEQAILSELLSDHAAERLSGLGAVLFGPRGNGKTVLLKDATSKAQSELDMDVVSLTPSICLTTEVLNSELLREVAMPVSAACSGGRCQSGKRIAGSADGARIGRPPTPNTTLAVQERIRRSGRPLVVAVDEAHRLGPKVGETLLDAVQATSGETKAAIALLAGTPKSTGPAMVPKQDRRNQRVGHAPLL